MHLRDLVKQTLANHGVYARQNARVKELLQYVEEHPLDCLAEYVPVFRERYYDLLDEFVPALRTIQDPLIRVAFIRHADPRQPKERALLQELVEEAEPEADGAVLDAIHRLRDKALCARIDTRRAEALKKRAARQEQRQEQLALKGEVRRAAVQAAIARQQALPERQGTAGRQADEQAGDGGVAAARGGEQGNAT